MADRAPITLPRLRVCRPRVSLAAILLLCFLLSIGSHVVDARFFPRSSWKNAPATFLSDGITRVKPERLLVDNVWPGDISMAENGRRLDEQKHVPRGPIIYHNGWILSTTPLNVYLIFYGDWSNGAESVITTFVQSLTDDSVPAPSVSRWWGTALKYHDRKGHVSSEVRLAGVSNDDHSEGRGNLTLVQLQHVVYQHINNGTFPEDTSALYVILASNDTATPGFCSDFCGFHKDTKAPSGQTIFWAFIGAHDLCVEGCMHQSAASPSGLPSADAMANTLGHELVEATTDPDRATGWSSEGGDEGADLCAWRYLGTREEVDARGVAYEWNLQGSEGRRFLIQPIFDPELQSCQQQWNDSLPAAALAPAPVPVPGTG